MSPEPVTSERVYQRLKAEILGGSYPPGTVLVTQAIADRFGVSISPVRDSAQRMIGERLLDAHHGGGFMLPEISVESLHDLYVWHGQLVRQALKRSTPENALSDHANIECLDTADPSTLARSAASLFSLIGERSRNVEHIHAIIAAGERLHFARLVEPRLIPEVFAELQEVRMLTTSGPESALREAVSSYHRRRIRRIPRLVKELGQAFISA